jgi:hypothetical protein
MRTRVSLMIALVMTVAALVLPASAQATADPTAADDQYGAVLGEQSGGGGNLQGAGSLPFTGLDLALLIGLGTGMTAAGIALRRATRPAAR